MVLQSFSSIGNLFHSLGTRKDKHFWPMFVFLKGCNSFINEVLVAMLPWCDSLKISNMYSGHLSWKYFEAVVHKHCKNLSEVFNLFIFSNLLYPIWVVFLKSKQKRIHLFCAIWISSFKSFVNWGYYAEQA